MMKIPKLPKLTKRLQVTARTLSETGSPDFAPAQPTARLGSAFVLAFSCHMLLILGMFSFHKIRAGRVPSEKVASSKTEKATGEKMPERPVAQTGGDPAKPSVSTSGGEAVAAAARAALALGVGGAAAGVVAPSKSGVDLGAAAARTDIPSRDTAGEVKASSRTHVVKTGDNPVRIAKSLGVKLEDLLALNGIDDPKKLKVGQTLKVPEVAKVERPVTAQVPSASSGAGKTSSSASKTAGSVTKSSKTSSTISKNGNKGTGSSSKK